MEMDEIYLKGDSMKPNCEHDDNDGDPLEFLHCELCNTLTANYQLTACIFRDENEEPDSLDLCPHCKDKNGK